MYTFFIKEYYMYTNKCFSKPKSKQNTQVDARPFDIPSAEIACPKEKGNSGTWNQGLGCGVNN
jgi:hypothetical protein